MPPNEPVFPVAPPPASSKTDETITSTLARATHRTSPNAQTTNHMKRLNLILNGKGGVGKSYVSLLHVLNQPTKTAVGRLTLCKPFLATAAVWLDSVARCCGSHLGFCFAKPARLRAQNNCQWTWLTRQTTPVGTIECQVDTAADNESKQNIQEQTQSIKSQPAQKAGTPIMNEKSILFLSRLPARLDMNQTAEILGFLSYEIPVLMSLGLLNPWAGRHPMATSIFAPTKFWTCPTTVPGSTRLPES